MNKDSQAAIIINDLDSLIHRIEALDANPHYTWALTSVMKAREEIIAGRSVIHEQETKQRFGT